MESSKLKTFAIFVLMAMSLPAVANNGGGGNPADPGQAQSQQAQQQQQQAQQSAAFAAAGAIAGAGASATGGEGGDGYSEGGDAFSEGGTVGNINAGTGDSSVKNKNKSNYLNFGMAVVNIADCMSAKHIGGGGNGGGGLIQWASTDRTCVMNKMADAERHVNTRARLKCGAKEYREAMTFDFVEAPKLDKYGHKIYNKDGSLKMTKPNAMQKQLKCVTMTEEITRGEIDYLRELVEKDVVIVTPPNDSVEREERIQAWSK